MTTELFVEIFSDIIASSKNFSMHKKSCELRQSHYKSLFSPLVKLAFDSRRVDSETEYNPRRGLQFYNRSESFISEAVASKLKNFTKLKGVLDNLKNRFGKKAAWQDSYARVLLNSLERALRTHQQDGDYTDTQPGIGSLDYLEEMLYVRYRLSPDDLTNMSQDQLSKVILDKDKELTADSNNSQEITRSDVSSQPYDSLIDKLFGGIKATKENPEVERTITITIKDRFVE